MKINTGKFIDKRSVGPFVFIIIILFTFSYSFGQNNILTNGGFEDNTTGWTVWGANLTTTEDSHSGTYAALLSNRKNPWDALVRDVTQIIENGKTYSLEAWFKFPEASSNFRATLALNVDGNTTYQTILNMDSPIVGSYQFYAGDIFVEWFGNLISANIYFEAESVGGVYSDYQVDDVSLVKFIPEPDAVIEGDGFKDIKSSMRIGGCIIGNKNYFTDSTAKEQVLKDCNTVTLTCYPAWGRWDETRHHVYHVEEFSNKIREIKKQNLHVTAHMLLGWDLYFPDWYKNNDFQADTLDAIMKSWLNAIITYPGNDTLVDVWNVVNEAISWDGKGGYWPENNPNHNDACEMQGMGYEPDSSGLTGSQFVNAQHPVYIRKSFEYARTLTKKKLELRDSGMEFPTDSKYNAFYQLAAHLKKMNVPVDAVGFQTHIDLEKTYDWEGYTRNIKRYVDLGYQVYIPEVDIGDVAKNWSEDKAELQKTQYYKLVTAAIKGGASEMQTWGFIDNDSDWRKDQSAFPYTHNFVVKPAYHGIKEALTDMSSLLFWEMDGPIENIMPDVMIYNNFGTLNNFGSPLIVSGFKSKALQFDGLDDYITTGNLSDSISGNFTFSCFLKTTSTNAAVIADLAIDGISGIKIGMNSEGKIFLDAEESGLDADLTGSIVLNDNNWHFVALQRDSSSYRLYVDSAMPIAIGQGVIVPANQLAIGAKSDGSSPIEGIMDEVKLYDSAIENESFTRNMVPFSPVKLVKTVTGMTLKLSWPDQSNFEEGFVVERKIANGIWEEHAMVGANILSFSETLDLWQTEYFYRVRAFTRFGSSNPTNTVSYISPTDPRTGLTGAPKNLSCLVIPNPVQGNFTLKTHETVLIKIYDLQGKLMLERRNCGSSETFDIAGFSTGIYLLQASSVDNSTIIKLIKN